MRAVLLLLLVLTVLAPTAVADDNPIDGLGGCVAAGPNGQLSVNVKNCLTYWSLPFTED